MNLLLDTHTWLWQMLFPEQLSAKARKALTDEHNELFLSPISVWEGLLLAQKGRIELHPTALEWTRTTLQKADITMAELTHEIAMQSMELANYSNKDPADRFLIATALINDLVLVTADESIRSYKRVPTLW